jgi:hypothetical protein
VRLQIHGGNLLQFLVAGISSVNATSVAAILDPSMSAALNSILSVTD